MHIFYLSLPVFSHWQGQLDPRVMILERAGRGGGRGLGLDLRSGGHRTPGVGMQEKILEVGNIEVRDNGRLLTIISQVIITFECFYLNVVYEIIHL